MDLKLVSSAALALATFLTLASASAQNEAETSGITVSAPDSLTSPNESSAANESTPGGLTSRSADDMRRGRASNFEDLLQRAPGVFLQSENGTEVSKISIRGSGITSEDEPLGVMFLVDGLSYNQADGEAILEDLDVGSFARAEIFRGAAAFKYGALTLGGAINLVPFTGYDAPLVQTRIDAGSYGFLRAQVSGGAVEGALDEFGSLTFRMRDGFRDHSAENTEILFANVGYKLSDNIENRIYLTLDRTDRDLPGGLTKAEMNADPSQANAIAVAQDWNKTWSYTRLADKLTLRDDGFELTAGAFWFHRDLQERGFFSDEFAQGTEEYYSDNIGANVEFVSRYDLLGRRNLFTIGSSPQYEAEHTQNYENLDGRLGATTARGDNLSLNLPTYFEDQFYFTRNFSVVTGGQFIFAQRHFIDRFVTDLAGDQSHEEDFIGFNPKLGAMYDLNRETQIFANVSRSWQPPSFDNMEEFSDGPNSTLIYTPLHPQHSWAAEIGTRGKREGIEWELCAYRSWLRDELLELNDAFGNDIGATNVRRTIHQGIEAALEVEVLANLSFDQSYTWNDFHFDRDAVYGNNRIAGIPGHFYEAQLLYQLPSGFYAGPNIQCNLTRYPVDHANTLSADSYALLGFRIGYRKTKGPALFLDCRNLTNKRYASAIDPIADARTSDDPQVFHPGEGRAFYGGVSWTW